MKYLYTKDISLIFKKTEIKVRALLLDIALSILINSNDYE